MRRAPVTQAVVKFGEADLTTCDREPIHIPGSIQPHGVLLVMDRQTLRIEQVAGDAGSLIGAADARLSGMPLSAVLDADAEGFVAGQLAAATENVAPVMRLNVGSRTGTQLLDLTVHALGRTAIVELESVRSEPVGDFRAITDPIARLKHLLSAVQMTASVEECCAAAAISLRQATGFDRAMVYRFLPDDSGEVVAEDAREGLESFLGLHYPASDIPQQARELYRRNWIRTIPDINYMAAPLTPPMNPRTGMTIDMSHCALRSVSPIHIEYLRNMGVCASMSASIVCQEKLWGMLVLHHYSPRYVAADLRVACETFAQIFSLHVDAKAQGETSVHRLNAQRSREELVATLASAKDIGAVISAWDLMPYIGATGAIVHLEGKTRSVGVTPPPDEIGALIGLLNGMNRPLYATDQLSVIYPRASGFSAIASGLLAVGLSREPRDYVLWFRPEIGRTVRWAGNPSKQVKVARHGARLTPRGSFAEWLEVTRFRSASWSSVDLEAAEALRVVLLENVLKSINMTRREKELEATRAMAEELERRVVERTEQLHALASELEAVEDRERRQIARDLHDDLGQTLAAARIRLATLCDDRRTDVQSKAREVGSLIDVASRSIRSLAAQLAPAVLSELGISAALDWLGEEIERTFSLRVTVVDDGNPKPLNQDARSIVYRAVRELLINVAKHAGTDSVTVDSERHGAELLIRVTDKGKGYDPGTVITRPQRGLGLISIRERLSLIGGIVEIQTALGAGTRSVLKVPLANEVSEVTPELKP
jgi:light-regulated signal transduction histidine kinase (bacteriophytochrome)